MIDEKMPKAARERWPLICFEEMILWVPGYGRCDPYQVKDNAAPILHLALQRGNQIDQAA
jgi:hypothetical protein